MKHSTFSRFGGPLFILGGIVGALFVYFTVGLIPPVFIGISAGILGFLFGVSQALLWPLLKILNDLAIHPALNTREARKMFPLVEMRGRIVWLRWLFSLILQCLTGIAAASSFYPQLSEKSQLILASAAAVFFCASVPALFLNVRDYRAAAAMQIRLDSEQRTVKLREAEISALKIEKHTPASS